VWVTLLESSNSWDRHYEVFWTFPHPNVEIKCRILTLLYIESSSTSEPVDENSIWGRKSVTIVKDLLQILQIITKQIHHHLRPDKSYIYNQASENANIAFVNGSRYILFCRHLQCEWVWISLNKYADEI